MQSYYILNPTLEKNTMFCISPDAFFLIESLWWFHKNTRWATRLPANQTLSGSIS